MGEEYTSKRGCCQRCCTKKHVNIMIKFAKTTFETCNRPNTKCCLITWIILIPLLIALALLLFFLIPRKHKEEFLGVNNYALSPTNLLMNVSYSIRVNNKNWVPIKIGKSHIEVWYRNETFVGETNPDNIVFPKRKDTTHIEYAVITNDNPATIAILRTGGSLKSFTTRGYIRVVYLGVGFKFDINETFEVDMTQTKRFDEKIYEAIRRAIL